MTRRDFFKGVGTFGIVVLGARVIATPAYAAPVSPNAFTGAQSLKWATTGAKDAVESDKITLVVPEIAENGAVVPVKVDVNHPMEPNNYVTSISVIAEKNGNSRCAKVNLTPANGEASFATRVKLGTSQNIIAVATLSDGTSIKTHKSVKVTIGGCG